MVTQILAGGAELVGLPSFSRLLGQKVSRTLAETVNFAACLLPSRIRHQPFFQPTNIVNQFPSSPLGPNRKFPERSDCDTGRASGPYMSSEPTSSYREGRGVDQSAPSLEDLRCSRTAKGIQG